MFLIKTACLRHGRNLDKIERKDWVSSDLGLRYTYDKTNSPCHCNHVIKLNPYKPTVDNVI